MVVNPKFGYTCKITSSGKNFSFADDCIFIRNELRDQCGIKGLWVGDVVLVDATFNHMRRNWVASSVTLVQRNNTGYNLMQESITKMQAELLQAAGVPLPNTAAGGEGGDGEHVVASEVEVDGLELSSRSCAEMNESAPARSTSSSSC